MIMVHADRPNRGRAPNTPLQLRPASILPAPAVSCKRLFGGSPVPLTAPSRLGKLAYGICNTDNNVRTGGTVRSEREEDSHGGHSRSWDRDRIGQRCGACAPIHRHRWLGNARWFQIPVQLVLYDDHDPPGRSARERVVEGGRKGDRLTCMKKGPRRGCNRPQGNRITRGRRRGNRRSTRRGRRTTPAPHETRRQESRRSTKAGT
jgi:hypothetical protein